MSTELVGAAAIEGPYRYTLDRVWRPCSGLSWDRLVWVMLNPSTADAVCDDPTIRRCILIAQAHGYAGMRVLNLFAWRATNPRDLVLRGTAKGDVVGPDNDRYLREAATSHYAIALAWGAAGARTEVRVRVSCVMDILRRANGKLLCLVVRSSTKLVLWEDPV